MPSRRRFLAGSASAVALATAGCLSGTPADAEPGTDENTEWPMPDHDVAASGYAENAAAPRSSPSERFAVETSTPNDRAVVADGVVYLPTLSGLLALDASDGTERWRYATEDEGSDRFRSPAVHDGTVYVTGEPGLLALDAEDGFVDWHLETDGDAAAPVAPMRDWNALFVGDENGVVYRVEPDGTVDWRFEVFGAVTRIVSAGVAGAYVGTAGGEVYALYDGRGLWRRRVPGKVTALARDGDEPVVSTFGGGVLKLANGAHAGRPRWHAEDGPVAHRAFALGGSGVFGADLSGIARLDARSGEQAWDLGDDHGSAPAAAGDTVYVSGAGEVVAYKLSGGVGRGGTRLDPRRWTYDLDGREGSHVSVADGAVFVPVFGSEDPDRSPGLVALE